MYIADTKNHRIRKVTISTGLITTIAGTGDSSYSSDGGDATSAPLNNPYGVALDTSGTTPHTSLSLYSYIRAPSGNVYIADTYNSRIRKVTIATGSIFTVAGSGNTGYKNDNSFATTATLNLPTGVALDSAGTTYSLPPQTMCN